MENPFAKFTTRDWLYVGGAVASIVALIAFIYKTQNAGASVVTAPGTLTDETQPAVGYAQPGLLSDAAPLPNYLTYNMGNPSAPAVMPSPTPAGADMSPNPEGRSCCCPQNNDCAGNSALATGDTFGSLDDLLTYYQNTNPNYVELQKVQMQEYASYFATGQSYSRGAVTLDASGISAIGGG